MPRVVEKQFKLLLHDFKVSFEQLILYFDE